MKLTYSTHRGGIRGIVELEVLRAIQQELGGTGGEKIPIQAFFDLIVGTRQVFSLCVSQIYN
jgi:patatin-like phospholipase/acyl hydrolase